MKKIADFRFRIEIAPRCAFPLWLHSNVVRAGYQALQQLPRHTLRSHLNPAQVQLVTIGIVWKTQIQQLNRTYRKKDRPTDVLSFSRISDKPQSHKELSFLPEVDIGDIIICWPITQEQAKANGGSAREELQELVVHGILHLFGYDHEKSKKEAEKMFRLQRQILSQLK